MYIGLLCGGLSECLLPGTAISECYSLPDLFNITQEKIGEQQVKIKHYFYLILSLQSPLHTYRDLQAY